MDTQDPALSHTHSVQVLMHLQQERQDTTPERLYTGKLCQDETAQATQDLSSYTRASAVKKAFDTFPEIAGTLPIALKVVAKVVAVRHARQSQV